MNIKSSWFPIYIVYVLVLTDDIESECEWHLRLSVDLALVYTRVALLRELNLQGPVVGLVRPDDLEPLVGRVGEDASGEDVEVPLADPRDLQ